MKKFLIISVLFFLLSCNKEIVVIHDFKLPSLSCPKKLEVIWDEYDVSKTEEENKLVELNNIAKAKRLMENRNNIILCYEKYMKMLKEFQKKAEERKRRDESQR